MSPQEWDTFLLADEAEPVDHDVRRERTRKIVYAGLAGVATAGIVGLFTLTRPFLGPDDFEGPGTGAVIVRISSGDSAAQVAETLAKAGVVASPGSFVRVVEDRAKSGSLRPGDYKLSKGMAASVALDRLLDRDSRVSRRVTIPEGLRAKEVYVRLSAASGFPVAEFEKAAAQPETLGLPSYAKTAEGFLFPATYEVEPSSTAKSLLRDMAAQFGRVAERIGMESGEGLSPLQVVTTASIVQAEGGSDDDYPKIARVIYNRLKKGGRLEMDTTVLYAQNRRTLNVSEKDTQVRSPYNTYRIDGLPPGPISNPGEQALLAALKPAKGDWYWFVTTDPGRRITKFTDNEGEFVKYREELNRYLGTN
ncbi:endolytic transglycosylase MltG [Herbidospora mongoliensis]|uniref:endolytic transglycosylase MltG n=1 Tax=Herbidospora mongoliensis TaxID=688067 RepID=UPI00082E048B|nr:endolytic transglycosylase MltG [Herbidospora mongoliensis]